MKSAATGTNYIPLGLYLKTEILRLSHVSPTLDSFCVKEMDLEQPRLGREEVSVRRASLGDKEYTDYTESCKIVPLRRTWLNTLIWRQYKSYVDSTIYKILFC